MKCICGSRDIDFQESSGHAICCVCGKIIEENTIVSSLEFEETGDRSHVVGQFISAEGTAPIKSGSRIMNRYTGTGESREITLANARRAIHQVASILRLPTLYIDKAYRLYNRALQMRFMYGRQQTHIVATCLYTICRIEKSPHLLIDFSDALQVNVYVIGRTFLQFLRLLNLQQQLKVIDPALYLHRFALRLDLGDKFTIVNNVALRIITRMKKDWILFGRRPDGICAVAMLVAMRCNGIDAKQSEISKVFKISEQTLRQRLDDFRSTPAAQLTIQQFNSILPLSVNENEIDNSSLDFDPPSFIRNQLESVCDDNFPTMVSFAFANENFDEIENVGIEEEFNCNSSKINKVSFNGIILEVPLPNRKKRKISAKNEFNIKERDDLYESMFDNFNEYSQATCLNKIEQENQVISDGTCNEVLNTDLTNLISNEEMNSYILSESERQKRFTIFEKSFRSLLNERQSKKETIDKAVRKNSRNTKFSNSGAVQLSISRIIADGDKKSKKINYEALKSAFNGDNLASPIDIVQNNTILSSNELSKQAKTLKAGTLTGITQKENLGGFHKFIPTETEDELDKANIKKSTESGTSLIKNTFDDEEDYDDLMYEVDEYDDCYDDME